MTGSDLSDLDSHAPETGIHRGAKTLSIMPTYTCTAACASCASLSSPQERTTLPLQDMIDAITQAKELGFFNVVFTGGEATLRWRDLLVAIRHATDLGLPTRLVTNAHWARSPDRADARLAELVSQGLREINFSTGDQHIRFVPVERVLVGTAAAVRADLPVVVMVELTAARTVTAKMLRESPILALLTPEQVTRIRYIESPWMPLDPGVTEQYPTGVATDRNNVLRRPGCSNVLQTYTVQSDGRVGACCGIGMRTIPELSPASTREPEFLKNSIERAENDFLKVWIHYTGPEKILAWAAEKNPRIKWEGRYAHHCQACARLYKDPVVADVIRSNWEQVVGEVLQSAWLDEHYVKDAVQQYGHG